MAWEYGVQVWPVVGHYMTKGTEDSSAMKPSPVPPPFVIGLLGGVDVCVPEAFPPLITYGRDKLS